MSEKKTEHPRITDETLSPVVEDTQVKMAPKTLVVEEPEENPHVKCNNMKTFKAWGNKYGLIDFMVPVNGQSNQEPEYASIQGVDMYIDKGVFLSIPRNVAELLATKYKIQMNLGSNMRIDGNKEKMDRLG